MSYPQRPQLFALNFKKWLADSETVQETGLSTHDSARLDELVAIVDANAKGFIAVGNALVEIKNKELYRVTHKSFEAFCQDRWGFEKSHSYRLIGSSRVVGRLTSHLSPMGDNSASQESPIGDRQSASSSAIILPTAETQVRELAKVDEEDQAEVWAKVVEVTDTPTTGIVKSVVSKWNKLKEAIAPKPKPKVEIVEEAEADTEDDTESVEESLPNGGKVYRHDAPMPEWFMDDNSVAVPEELYPAWRAKQRFFELANSPMTKETCDQIVSLGQELEHPATIELGHEMLAKLLRFQNEFRREIASGEPHVLSADKTTWLSKREVANG